MKRIILFLSISAIYFSSCTKTADSSTSGINFQLKAANSAINGAGIVWSAGTAGVASAKIESKKKDSTYIEFKQDTNIQIDLFGTLSITGVIIPVGTYYNNTCKLELQVLSNKPALFLEGIYTAGGIATPVSFEVAVPVTIKSTKEIIEISKGVIQYNAITTIALTTLSTDVTEAEMKAAVRTGGKIIISRTSNDGIYFKMLANLAKNQVIEFKQ
jgi:hypothetical protein